VEVFAGLQFMIERPVNLVETDVRGHAGDVALRTFVRSHRDYFIEEFNGPVKLTIAIETCGSRKDDRGRSLAAV
jgi:hypothetical protein